jgi:3-oxoacyl-(acyl-carrier-protein) synthase
MDKIFIAVTSLATETDLKSARLGPRFARLDLQSQLALLAVELLEINFEKFSRERIAICLAAKTGSLSTDVEFWNGRDNAGGPSPILFAYTLPSAAIGEIAIRHKLTGPNLCFVADDKILLSEAADLIRRGEADACVCVYCEIVSAELAKIIQLPQTAFACAIFLERNGKDSRELTEFDRDMKSFCANFGRRKTSSGTGHEHFDART